MLDWLDGRNGSSFANVATSAGRLTFSLVRDPQARGLEAMVPAASPAGPLSRLTRNGQPVSRSRARSRAWTTWSSTAQAGDYVATYATDARRAGHHGRRRERRRRGPRHGELDHRRALELARGLRAHVLDARQPGHGLRAR